MMVSPGEDPGPIKVGPIWRNRDPWKEAETREAPQGDAKCLRDAARILWNRARKRTFMLRVICRVLRHTADHIEARQP